jgi:MFS transporter, LPLT family, lysophospholipid transporter
MQNMPRGFYTLMCAQFFSAWADNALLIVAISHLRQEGQALWMAPMLKFGFAMAYVCLAPWVGVVADVFNKSVVMWWSHLLKWFGVLGMVLGLNALACYAWVGVGAALYSPAKYGWVGQMVPASQLVKANGWIETLTVLAALAGVVSGGWWISEEFTQSASIALAATGLTLKPMPAYWMIMVFYAVTWAMTWCIPQAPQPVLRASRWISRPLGPWLNDLRTLWQDPGARTSLAVTTLFWGIGACMQVLVLDWSAQSLGLSLEQGAYMQGISVLGVIAGAWWAGRTVTLDNHRQTLKSGLWMALLLPSMWVIGDWRLAAPLIVVLGFASGYLVVPMNAMLQHRGVQVLSAGRSIAVQNFNENISILFMLGVYATVIGQGGSWRIMTLGFALSMALVCAGLMRNGHAGATAPDPSSGDALPPGS